MTPNETVERRAWQEGRGFIKRPAGALRGGATAHREARFTIVRLHDAQ
jgi:hypothetical protein